MAANWSFEVETENGAVVRDDHDPNRRSRWLDLRDGVKDGLRVKRVSLVRENAVEGAILRLPAAEKFVHLKKVSCEMKGAGQVQFSYAVGYITEGGAVIVWGEADGSIRIEHRSDTASLEFAMIPGVPR